MKISAAAVLLSLSSASAFSVSYLNQLSTNAASAPSGAGMTSYLDGISGAEQVPALVTALEQAAPVAPAATAAPTSGDYLSALGGTATPVTGGGITSYLDALPATPSSLSGAGLTGYLDALPTGGASPVSGSGITSYLDTVGGSAPAAPVAAAPVAAAPVAAAPAAPVAAAVPVANTAPAAGDYLSTLNSGASTSISGGGMNGYLDVLPTNAPMTGGPGLTGYLGTLGSSAATTSGAGLTGYLDALATNSEITGPSGGSSLTSFLESVYSQIMSLPEDGSRKVAGGSVTFAKAEGSYAMSFVKK